jgi:hypothetical protein
MINFSSSFKLSRVAADVMNDLWQKRSRIKGFYFAFRMEADQPGLDDEHVTLYAHFFVEGDLWHLILNDDYIGMTREKLTEDYDYEQSLDLKRVTSARHYAFGDLVQPMIEEELDRMSAEAGITPTTFTLYNTFPLETIYR